MTARALMVQGTCSGAGKSLLVAGLCRILSDEGVKAAPFKAQNMALNSSVTEDGREIGRAQALQAEAARLKPSADMNPVLLKATGDAACQVIVNGRVHSNMSAKEYYAFTGEAWQAVTEAYERLSRGHEIILIEGPERRCSLWVT
jgi:adenosylcobyric acid synthase